MPRKLSTLILALSLVMGCESKKQDAPIAPPPAPAKEPPKTEARAPAAPAGPVCVGALRKTGAVHKRGPYELDGYRLRDTRTDPDDIEVFGLLSDIKEDTPENLANLDKFVEWFKAKGIEKIIVAGDSGETRDQIVHAISRLAGSIDASIFVIIGNRESLADYHAAITTLQARHDNVFDLDRVRLIDGDDADIISLPGYYDPKFLHAKDGCAYSAADVKDLARLVAEADDPVVLVSHGPPRMQGPKALDRIAEGANVGDPGLAAFLRQHPIPFGVFGNIHEAGGHGVSPDGTTLINEGKLVPRLYVNPGAADAVHWTMNDGTESAGMAGLLAIKGGKARYEIYRLPVD